MSRNDSDEVQCHKRQPRSLWTPLFAPLAIYIAEGKTGEVLRSSLLVVSAGRSNRYNWTARGQKKTRITIVASAITISHTTKWMQQATFPDAASLFPEDEWKFLQDWQKDLYRNVMKEIHQALISLGPLIVTTVCSLRAKEKEELYPVVNQYVSRKHGMNQSPSETMANHDVLLKINSNEPLHLNNHQTPEEKKMSDRCSTELPFLSADIRLSKKEDKPVSLYIDPFGTEIIEDSTDANSGCEVVSVCIKDEEETNYMDLQYSKNSENNSSHTGVNSMKRQNTRGTIKMFSEKSASFKVFQKTINTTALQHSHMGNISSSQVWSENDWELQEKVNQCESTFASPAPFRLHQGSPVMERSNTMNTFETNMRNSQFPEDVPSKQQAHRKYSVEEYGKSDSLKAEHSGQSKRNATVRPYACPECDKSFFEKRYLITHRRTHSLEKPYTCTFCYKSFNRKDNLNGHIRIHTGERPYTCTNCEKNFRRKSDLNQHQRKHAPCKRAKPASLTIRPTAIKVELDRPSMQ